MHHVTWLVGHLAVVVRRGPRDGTLMVKEERDSSGIVRFVMVDFI